jgi:hypothetical protein
VVGFGRSAYRGEVAQFLSPSVLGSFAFPLNFSGAFVKLVLRVFAFFITCNAFVAVVNRFHEQGIPEGLQGCAC